MLKKLFQTKWFIILVHIIIVLGIFFNGFYTLENYKVAKGNQKLTDQKSQLEQDKKNLLDQNSYEFLENYKDKTIKRAGFKKTGEEIFDISTIDKKKDEQRNQNQIPNLEKWYKCIFTKNSDELAKQYKNNPFEENSSINNLCK
jgi:FtsZ-interacting cell division protein ZipA